jgi:hypothetical protein
MGASKNTLFSKHTALEIKFDPQEACAIILIFSSGIGNCSVKMNSPF